MFKFSTLDFLFLPILLVLSLFLISFYFGATALNTNYPDWIVHAFRVKQFESYGLASWTHSWANGISLWKSYQFLPHAMTVGVMHLFNLPATQAMVVLTSILFVFIRLSMYVFLRLLQFSPLTSFICAVLSYDIAQYWGGVADYSLMFGFAFFPVYVYLWVKYYEGNIQYIFPYLIGLSFYMHPVLGYSMTGLWLTGIIFSDRKIFSWTHVIQFIIFLAAASLFWFPIVFKQSYSYTSPVFANKYFLNLVISGYKYFGLSLFILFALFLSSIRVFLPIEKKFKWTKVLYIFIVSYFVLILLGLNVDLPKALAQLQFTRAVTIIGLGIIFIFAAVVEDALRIRSTAFKGALLVFLALVIIEGLWLTSIYSPNPTNRDLPEAVSAYDKKHPQNNLYDARIWTSNLGQSGYYASLNARYPYSYMGHLESNQVSPRISPLVLYQPYPDKVPLSNIARLNDYFKITGVRYVFFDEQSAFTNSLLSSDKQIYKDLGQVRNGDSTYHAFEVPWEIRNAAAIDAKYTDDLKPFPAKLELMDVNDQTKMDNYVKNFVEMLYKPENMTLQVNYPSYDTLQVRVPSTLTSNIVFINESFDAGWKAYFNKQAITIQPSGPNFSKVTLPKVGEQGTIFLKHNWPVSFYISIYLIVLIPLEMLLFTMSRRIFFRKEQTV